jgi:hypothetical protein
MKPMDGAAEPAARLSADAVGARIVLTCRSELSFCGLFRGAHRFGPRDGFVVETDSASGLSIWCPVDFVREVTVIPIRPEIRDDDPETEGPA